MQFQSSMGEKYLMDRRKAISKSLKLFKISIVLLMMVWYFVECHLLTVFILGWASHPSKNWSYVSTVGISSRICQPSKKQKSNVKYSITILDYQKYVYTHFRWQDSINSDKCIGDRSHALFGHVMTSRRFEYF